MSGVPDGAAELKFDGERLSVDGAGRTFQIDQRCVDGAPIAGAFAHVCALGDPAAALEFDHPEIQQVRRDALAWWIPLLGDSLVCLTTFALDEARYGGAVTVVTRPAQWQLDPFARIFPGKVVRTNLFSAVPPPAGPVVERYAGVAWPGGSFS